jgi:hypothetical protein
VKATSTLAAKIEATDGGVTGHAGLWTLGRFADRLGLGTALSGRVPWTGERAPVHDRGKVLVHQMLVLAGGGETCADIEHLRAVGDLFADAASDTTVWRTFHELGPATVTGLWEATAERRAEVWRRANPVGDAPVVLDIDATLVTIHSENKAGTGPTYKGGFGFHPMFCFADATGEALGAVLRPGNAAANSIADHLAVLDQAIGQLPADIAAGHRPGDDADDVSRAVVVRTDSAGCTRGFVDGCAERNVGFMVIARKHGEIHTAISRVLADDTRWHPALTQDGQRRPGAAVAELTDLADLSGWPAGTRLIVRREPLHPGAQQTLFASTAYRYWGFYTDQPGTPVELDQTMRAHAHVEDHIARLKDSGLERFPFSDLDANRAWLAVVCFAADLVRWFQRLCLTGELAAANPKRLRWQLWHAPARLVRRARQLTVRPLAHWPATPDLLAAHERIAALC